MSSMPSGSFVVERHFEEENVWVTVPTQANPRALEISDPLDIFEGWENSTTPNVFKPTRPVINFEVVEGEGGSTVHRFSPPMVLRVGMTDAEFQMVDEGRNLKLAFWDESRWVPFTKEKHHYQLHSKFAIAVIQDWGDPPMAWGE